MKFRKRRQNNDTTYDYSPTDPFGSYTGRTKDNDRPVQDADDL